MRCDALLQHPVSKPKTRQLTKITGLHQDADLRQDPYGQDYHP